MSSIFKLINVKNKNKQKKEVKILQSKKTQPLSGEHNKRLTAYRPVENEGTAAWANIDRLRQDGSKVSIPSELNVKEAKDWVDNGSRL